MTWKLDTVYRSYKDESHYIIVSKINSQTLMLSGTSHRRGDTWKWAELPQEMGNYECVGPIQDFPEYLL